MAQAFGGLPGILHQQGFGGLVNTSCCEREATHLEGSPILRPAYIGIGQNSNHHPAKRKLTVLEVGNQKTMLEPWSILIVCLTGSGVW